MSQAIYTKISESLRDAEKKDRFYGYLIILLSAVIIMLISILIDYN